MKRRILWLVELIAVLALLYSLVGLLQAAWLSATPHFPPERTRINLAIWGSGTLISLALVGLVTVLLVRARTRASDDS